jgi:hypothetical protein
MKKFHQLSRAEMKSVLGGVAQYKCVVTNNVDCGGGTSSYSCSGSLSDCQDVADNACQNNVGNECCDDITCS